MERAGEEVDDEEGNGGPGVMCVGRKRGSIVTIEDVPRCRCKLLESRTNCPLLDVERRCGLSCV